MPRNRKFDLRPVYYVYALFDWCGIPRYIGKGKSGNNRELDHERKTDRSNSLKNEFIEATWRVLGEIPKLKIREGLTEPEAFKTEIALIKAIGRIDLKTGPLTNLTNGGDGTPLRTQAASASQAKKVSQWWASLTSTERENFIRQRDTNIDPTQRRNTSRLLWENKSEEEKLAWPAKMSKIRKDAWNRLTAEERSTLVRSYFVNVPPEKRRANALRASRAASEAWNKRSPEERAVITAKMIAGSKLAWAAKTPEELAIIFARRGKAVSEGKRRAAERRKIAAASHRRRRRLPPTSPLGQVPRD